MSQFISRLFIFRRQLVTLWRAFWHPATPLYLKALMFAVVFYVFSPFDILPDFFIGVGFIDDVLLVAFAVSWIVKRLPREVFEEPQRQRSEERYSYSQESQYSPEPQEPQEPQGPTIDGTSRRL